jgi:hypothetical protein
MFFYCIFIAAAYAGVFNRKFSESLAPAFFIHIFVIFVGAVFFHHVTWGIAAGIVFALLLIVLKCIRAKSISQALRDLAGQFNDTGFIIFIVFYAFIAISNIGKHFMDWDEFNHWGIFLKETLRIDDLYCVSPKNIGHKDYVPAITLFEALWCRMSLRFEEADAYRAIQMLQFSMILPMIRDRENGVVVRNKRINVYSIMTDFFKAVFVLALPLLFSGQSFYHTIYQDMIFGCLIFYCVYLVWSDISDEKYRAFVLTISLTMLVLSKMVAMAFLPMVVVYYIVSSVLFHKENGMKKIYWGIAVFVPFLSWVLINKYISIYVPPNGDGQTYSGISISDFINVFSHDGAVSYQADVQKAYLSALIHTGTVGGFSYIAVLAVVMAGIFAFIIVNKSRKEKIELLLLELWIVLAGIAYALIMYYLYMTAFGEYEARALASYSRYMSSYLIAAVLLFVAAFYRQRKLCNIVVMGGMTFAFGLCIIKRPIMMQQILPGYMTNDISDYSVYESYADTITEYTPEDVHTTIYVVTCGDTGNLSTHLNYYTNPRTLAWGSIGAPRYEGDVWSTEMTIADFVNTVSGYKYLYLAKLDDNFTKVYGDAFEDINEMYQGNLMKVKVENGKICKTD